MFTNRDLQHLIYNYGPVQILVNASNWKPFYYSSLSILNYPNVGDTIYQSSNFAILKNKEPDHAIQLIGWTTYKKEKYWILRNEWGETFTSANGYIMVKWGNSPWDCFYGINYIKKNKVNLEPLLKDFDSSEYLDKISG